MASKKKSAAKSKTPVLIEEGSNAEGAAPEANTAGDSAHAPTLADAASGYLAWLDKHGAGDGTLSSYRMELKLAMRELGEATLLASLTADRVAEYFACDALTKTRHGKHKAKATIDKSRRVLRLALVWAQDEQLIAVAPIPATAAKPVKFQAV